MSWDDYQMIIGWQWDVCCVKLCWELGPRGSPWLAEECHPWRADWDDVLTADRYHGTDWTIKGIWNSNSWRCCCCDALQLASRCRSKSCLKKWCFSRWSWSSMGVLLKVYRGSPFTALEVGINAEVVDILSQTQTILESAPYLVSSCI